MICALAAAVALIVEAVDPPADASSSGANAAAQTTITYRAEIPHGEWPGWNFDPDPERRPLPPEQFELVRSDGRSARTFSGKIVGLKSMAGVEVVLESLVGIPWVHPDEYQWQKVAPDGTFSIKDAHFLGADKAIGLRGPHTAWTFLRFNFAPNHGAKNIVLKAAPSRSVTVTASGPDRKDFADIEAEIFDAYSQTDDHGNWLNRQQGGSYFSDEKKSLDLVVPLGEVALFVHHRGWPGFYQIVDARQGDHFHFVMMPGGELKIRTLDAAGKPKSGVSFNWRNPAAPLSYWAPTTNEQGEFLGRDLVPGTFEINAPGFALFHADVEPNAETDVVLQEGKEPAIAVAKMNGE